MTPGPDKPSVALTHHWLMSMRGGEKLLAALAEIFPHSPIYTLLARPAMLDESLRRRDLRTSWLQRFHWIPDFQRKALPFLAAGARSLDARGYDAVVCSDAAIVKAIRVRPEALKICYCHTPMRYVWDLYEAYYRSAGPAGRAGLRLFAGRLREADRRAADGVAAFVANSTAVAGRIRRCYGRASAVIPPPVDVDALAGEAPPGDFYLVVGECVPYKRHDLAVDACTRLNRRLVVIGTGPTLRDLRRRAGRCVEVIGWQSDEVVRDHLRRCRALLFPGEEDFGLVPVEAQAAGRPVIAYHAGGVLDTVVHGGTGLLFEPASVEGLIAAIEQFESCTTLWPADRLREHARQFSRQVFLERFRSFFAWCVGQWRTGGPRAVRQAMEDRPASPWTG